MNEYNSIANEDTREVNKEIFRGIVETCLQTPINKAPCLESDVEYGNVVTFASIEQVDAAIKMTALNCGMTINALMDSNPAFAISSGPHLVIDDITVPYKCGWLMLGTAAESDALLPPFEAPPQSSTIKL